MWGEACGELAGNSTVVTSEATVCVPCFILDRCSLKFIPLMQVYNLCFEYFVYSSPAAGASGHPQPSWCRRWRGSSRDQLPCSLLQFPCWSPFAPNGWEKNKVCIKWVGGGGTIRTTRFFHWESSNSNPDFSGKTTHLFIVFFFFF